MKCLSIRQPFADLILSGDRPVEQRTWSTVYRGPIVIHAATQWHEASFERLEAGHHVRAVRDPLDGEEKTIFADCVRGALIGVIDLVEVEARRGGVYHWIVENPRRFCPVSWRGAQGLFDIPEPDDLRELADALEEVT